MGALFSKPKMPTVQPPVPMPIVDQTFVDRQAGDLLRRRKGRAATDLTTAASAAGGVGTTGSVGVQKLLGS